MNKFGWSYPAGAGSDPYAPYNQEDQMDNSALAEAFSDYTGLDALYHAAYKYTACGPMVGATIRYEEEADDVDASPNGTGGEKVKTLYGDDLRNLGTWADMDRAGVIVIQLEVSSIVEGVEECTTTHYIDCDGLTFEPEEIAKYFWDAVAAVDKEAHQIWQETHGCETCAALAGNLSPSGEIIDGCDRATPVHKDCPDCGGAGVPI